MTNTAVLHTVEQLGYRVTVADVAAAAGLALHEAQREVLALATDVQAHLQVSETGEIAYEFPRNSRTLLLGKYWRLRFQAVWEQIWRVLFYLIRISFGILLILSLVIILAAIAVLIIALQSSRGQQNDDRDEGGFGGGFIFLPRLWISPDWFYLFGYDYGRPQRQRSPKSSPNELNFLEAIFSFLFGDGDPNRDLEERRWQAIATQIRNHQGAVVAEQMVPYLDDLGQGWARENEDYMIPVLSRFDGRPEVTPQGQLVYRFPELQVMAEERPRDRAISPFLQEIPRRFSRASAGQILGAVGLGGANLVAALALGSLLSDPDLVIQGGAFILFVQSIYGVLLGYGSAFLGIPLVRYFWVQWCNRQIEARNTRREERAIALQAPDTSLEEKLTFARQFATQTLVDRENLAYTTEKDLLEQTFEQIEAQDAQQPEGDKRLSGTN